MEMLPHAFVPNLAHNCQTPDATEQLFYDTDNNDNDWPVITRVSAKKGSNDLLWL